MTEYPEIPDLSLAVQAEQTHLAIPSRPHWIEPVVDYLRHKAEMSGACHSSRAGKLTIALHEALANAVIHGNLELSSELKEQGDNVFAEALAQRAGDPILSDRTVEILVDYDGERCRWMITDQGNGFDVEKVIKRVTCDDPEVLLSSGRGILMMKSFLDEVHFEHGGRRLILTLKRDSGLEKRHRDRVAMHQPLQIAPIRPDGSVDWDKAYDAVSRNMSEEGVAILQERLSAADRVLIGLYINDQPIYIPAEVRHVHAIGSEVVELGCRFQTRAATTSATPPRSVPVSSADEHAVFKAVNSLLEKHKYPALLPDERRAHPRVVFNERLEILTSKSSEPVIGYARDISKGGIAFIITEEISGDIVVKFRPRDGSDTVSIHSRVVRCNRITEGFFDIGAQFRKVEEGLS